MSFIINRNNEITEYLPELKRWFKTSNNTTAIYGAIEDYFSLITKELPKLRKIEKEYNKLLSIEKEQKELERQRKSILQRL